MEGKILLTRIEAAKYLGLANHTLDVWASNGSSDLKYIKIGRSVKYRKADLDEFIASRIMTSTKKPVAAEPIPQPTGPIESPVNNSADRESLMLVSQSLVNLSEVIKRHAKLSIYTKGIPSDAYKAVMDVMRDCFFELHATMNGDHEQAHEFKHFVDKGMHKLRLDGFV